MSVTARSSEIRQVFAGKLSITQHSSAQGNKAPATSSAPHRTSGCFGGSPRGAHASWVCWNGGEEALRWQDGALEPLFFLIQAENEGKKGGREGRKGERENPVYREGFDQEGEAKTPGVWGHGYSITEGPGSKSLSCHPSTRFPPFPGSRVDPHPTFRL